MIAFFDPEDIVKVVGLEGLDVRGIGTETIFGDNKLEMRMVLAQLGHKAFGSITFTIIFSRAILFYNGFRHQGNHFPHVRINRRS